MEQHEHRTREMAQRRQHAASIAANGLKPVTLVEVHTALVGWRHSMERAELAFTARGSTQQPEREIQKAALRQVHLAKLQYDEKASVFDNAQAEAQLDASHRIARGQFWTAVAIGVFTLVQTTTTVLQLIHGWNRP